MTLTEFLLGSIIHLFWPCVIALELVTGVAVLGLPYNRMVVDRGKNPGPFWVAIIIHLILAYLQPLLFWHELWLP